MKLAIISNCTSSGSVPVVPYLDGTTLGGGYSHTSAAAEWNGRVKRAFEEKAGLEVVKSLYTGISFRTILKVVDKLRAQPDTSVDLFIASLGFGLVNAEQTIASYNLNMQAAGESPASLLNIVTEEPFEPIRWWYSVNHELHNVFNPISVLIQEGGYDLVLVAVTNAFLGLICADVADAIKHPNFLKTVRVVGPKGTNQLIKYMRHISGTGVILPFSPQLNDLIPGNRNDFAQRAATYFINEVLIPSDFDMDLEKQRDKILQVMVQDPKKRRPTGSALTGEQLSEEITKLKERHTSVSAAYAELMTSRGAVISLDVFQRAWGLENTEAPSEEALDAAFAAMDTIGLGASRRDDQSEVIECLKLFVTALSKRGGGTFGVSDICSWAKVYYDRKGKECPDTLTRPNKLGRMLGPISTSLGIFVKPTNLGPRQYEVPPASAAAE